MKITPTSTKRLGSLISLIGNNPIWIGKGKEGEPQKDHKRYPGSRRFMGYGGKVRICLDKD